ncbi:hypothetical protein IMZ31_22170 (plasmid) [Pontibacillus sp. ALD_SL1]|uniref:hypothetical protein n=1 Tax=Pontibacillus sp. ALD_SL1 TaxID=2777185 RepID=UPI001A967730|nr:hypothetical protein [Pontibacillus sp. ALD_SL1]QST02161.1 hypothetical protein IMZ31_22170 [Pontibacillus sp. ALD_SL1]
MNYQKKGYHFSLNEGKVTVEWDDQVIETKEIGSDTEHEEFVKWCEEYADTTKELNVHMSMYMKYKGGKTKEELDHAFLKLVDQFCEANDMEYQVYDSETQEV